MVTANDNYDDNKVSRGYKYNNVYENDYDDGDEIEKKKSWSVWECNCSIKKWVRKKKKSLEISSQRFQYYFTCSFFSSISLR